MTTRSALVTILVFAVLIGAGYVLYRSAGIPKTIDVESGSLQNMQPAVCTMQGTGGTGITGGTVYFAHGDIRADYSAYLEGVNYHYHWIARGGTTYALWTDESLSKFPLLLPRVVSNCGAWWFPDASLFQVPDGVPALQGSST